MFVVLKIEDSRKTDHVDHSCLKGLGLTGQSYTSCIRKEIQIDRCFFSGPLGVLHFVKIASIRTTITLNFVFLNCRNGSKHLIVR